jgi:hypothetical protein
MFIYFFINIYKSFYEKRKKKSPRYHCHSNVWNSEDSNVFSVELLDILVNYIYIFVDLGKLF